VIYLTGTTHPGAASLLDKLNKRVLLYAGLALVPIVLFVLMLVRR